VLKVSLFWRTFLLIALLLSLSLSIGLVLIRKLDPTPPEQNLAWELASVVNLTRNALIAAQPSKRRDLLSVLEKEEGVRILPLEETDRVQQALPFESKSRIEDAVHRLIGADTILATRVNDTAGLWVSFNIEGDRYWLILPKERLDRQAELPLLPVLTVLALFALAGTYVMSRLVNKPLANLAHALSDLGQGKRTTPLREDLASEIASVNRRFNQMTRDLGQLEADRTLALAGISHDIRTPLTRLRMEVEMAKVPEDQRNAMIEDIERINEIVAQFMDYARAGRSTNQESVNVSERLAILAHRFEQTYAIDGEAQSKFPAQVRLRTDIEPGLVWTGNGTDLERMVGNLIENARRYGKTPGSSTADIHLKAWLHSRTGKDAACIKISVSDQGSGVPAAKLESLKKPFMRLDEARGVEEGAGLGLAIVERIAQRHGGQLTLGPTSPPRRSEPPANSANKLAGGLTAEVILPLAA
jgi:two-component system, OmpR family, osmolarity sensor histidine kinase EnvZ